MVNDPNQLDKILEEQKKKEEELKRKEEELSKNLEGFPKLISKIIDSNTKREERVFTKVAKEIEKTRKQAKESGIQNNKTTNQIENILDDIITSTSDRKKDSKVKLERLKTLEKNVKNLDDQQKKFLQSQINLAKGVVSSEKRRNSLVSKVTRNVTNSAIERVKSLPGAAARLPGRALIAGTNANPIVTSLVSGVEGTVSGAFELVKQIKQDRKDKIDQLLQDQKALKEAMESEKEREEEKKQREETKDNTERSADRLEDILMTLQKMLGVEEEAAETQRENKFREEEREQEAKQKEGGRELETKASKKSIGEKTSNFVENLFGNLFGAIGLAGLGATIGGAVGGITGALVGGVAALGSTILSLMFTLLSNKFVLIAAALTDTLFQAFMGSKGAEALGVNAIPGAIGAVLGGSEGGIINAFRSAGRVGITGAALGFAVGGPLGAIAGGITGAVLGGVAGYFGGDNVARILSDVFLASGDLVVDSFTSVVDFLEFSLAGIVDFFENAFNFLNDKIKEKVEGVKSFLDRKFGKKSSFGFGVDTLKQAGSNLVNLQNPFDAGQQVVQQRLNELNERKILKSLEAKKQAGEKLSAQQQIKRAELLEKFPDLETPSLRAARPAKRSRREEVIARQIASEEEKLKDRRLRTERIRKKRLEFDNKKEEQMAAQAESSFSVGNFLNNSTIGNFSASNPFSGLTLGNVVRPKITGGGGNLQQNVNSWVKQSAAKHGVPEELIWAVMKQESAGNINAMSSAGAIGLMQLMPGTAKDLGVDPFDVQQNIDGGAKYLSQQLKTFGGSVPLALAAYNAGPGNVRKFGGIPPFNETQNYVSRIMGFLGNSDFNVTAKAGSFGKNLKQGAGISGFGTGGGDALSQLLNLDTSNFSFESALKTLTTIKPITTSVARNQSEISDIRNANQLGGKGLTSVNAPTSVNNSKNAVINNTNFSGPRDSAHFMTQRNSSLVE